MCELMDEDNEECFVCRSQVIAQDYFTFEIDEDGEPILIEFCSEVCHYINQFYKCRDIFFDIQSIR